METSFKEIVCPIDAEWKFKKADLMDLKDNEWLTGKYYYAYNIPGLQYSVIIYPNAFQGETGIYFYVNGSEERKIDADYTVSVESANYSETVNYIFEECMENGSICCKTSEFFEYKSKYFVDGEITIKVNGTLKVNRPSTSMISLPISLKWKIKEADLKEAMNGESKTCLYSEDINVESFSDVIYYLSICTNGINDENQSFLYLNVDIEQEEKIQAVFDFSIVSANYNYGTQYVFDEYDDECDVHVCSTKDLFDPLKGYVVNGYLTINLNGILMKQKNHGIKLKFKKGVAQKSALKNGDKNFMIIVGEKEIQVHKQVLMEVSPVFAEMLESGMKEAIENKIYIEDFAFKTVDISIKLCYGISIRIKYPIETLLSIYRFGNKYRIGFIMDLIEEYLIKEISPSNIVYLLKVSSPDSLNVKKLHQKCIECLMKCSKDSTPVYASESLDEKFLASMVLSTFSSHG